MPRHFLKFVATSDSQPRSNDHAPDEARTHPQRNVLTRVIGMPGEVDADITELRPDLLELRLGQIPVMLDGMPARFETASVVQALSGAEIELIVDLHLGTHSATVWTCTGPAEQ